MVAWIKEILALMAESWGRRVQALQREYSAFIIASPVYLGVRPRVRAAVQKCRIFPFYGLHQDQPDHHYRHRCRAPV